MGTDIETRTSSTGAAVTILVTKCLNQIGNRDAQSVSNSSQILERRVALSAFDAAEVIGIQARFGSKKFLRPISFCA